VPQSDLPDALRRWQERSAQKDTDRTARHFMIPARQIADNAFDLSIKRYRQAKPARVEYAPPRQIAARLRRLEAEIANDLAELEGML
jgi:type I restriction enzyme M protein